MYAHTHTYTIHTESKPSQFNSFGQSIGKYGETLSKSEKKKHLALLQRASRQGRCVC